MGADSTNKALVLYDGRCPFCIKSVQWLKRLDWLARLEFGDAREPEQVNAAGVPLEPARLLEEMHLLTPGAGRRLPRVQRFPLDGLAIAAVVAAGAAPLLAWGSLLGPANVSMDRPQSVSAGALSWGNLYVEVWRRFKEAFKRRRFFEASLNEFPNEANSMTRRFVEQLADGDSVDEVYLVTDKQLRANRNGNLYLQLDLRDRTGADQRPALERQRARCSAPSRPATSCTSRARCSSSRAPCRSSSPTSSACRPNKVDLDRLPAAHRAGRQQAATNGCAALLLQAGQPAPARPGRVLPDRRRVRRTASARRRPASATTTPTSAACSSTSSRCSTPPTALAPLYPELDRDLLLIGIFLHDIGKVRELSYDRGFGYTDEGQLIGHLVIGVEMLNEKAASVPDLTGEPFPTELLLAAQAHDRQPPRHLRVRQPASCR